ncbi:hypothetical protein V2A28_32590, partial [Pseudomonas aeruginosa]
LVTKSAIRPGSNFNRQGGSIFHQRQQARVIAVRPRGEQMEITCVAEHSAVHSADGSVDSGTDPI